MRILRIIVGIVGSAVLAFVGGVWLFLVTPYQVADEPTPLMQAALSRDVEQTRQLLAQGAMVNERRKCSTRHGIFIAHGPGTPVCNDTALLVAIASRNTEIMQMLLEAGADTSVRDNHNSGVWAYATLSLGEQSVDAISLLAQHTAPSTDDIDRILYSVGYVGDRRLLEFALSKPHSATAREAVLCGAAGRGDIEMMTRMLETFDTVPAKSLGCAIGVPYNIRRPAIEFLLDRGADPNGDPQSWVHPLSSVILTMMSPGTAAQSVPPEVQDLLELLLERGADPRLTRNGGSSAIALARHHGHEAAAVLLESWTPKKQTPR